MDGALVGVITSFSILVVNASGAGGGAIGFLGGVGENSPEHEPDFGGGVCRTAVGDLARELIPLTAAGFGGPSHLAFLTGRSSVFTGSGCEDLPPDDGIATTDGRLSPGVASVAAIDLNYVPSKIGKPSK